MSSPRRRSAVTAGARYSGPSLLDRAWIAAENPDHRRFATELVERLGRGRILGGSVEIDPEDVLPAGCSRRSRFEPRQVEPPPGEDAKAAMERASDVSNREDERCHLRATLDARRRPTGSKPVPSDDDEPRPVVRAGLNLRRDHLQAV